METISSPSSLEEMALKNLGTPALPRHASSGTVLSDKQTGIEIAFNFTEVGVLIALSVL